MNSNFPYRWSPASLLFNNYFYLFLYLYITRRTINNNAPHLKSPKNQNRRAALGRPAMRLLGGLNQFAVDQPSPLLLLRFTMENNYEQKKRIKHKRKAKRAAGIEVQVASMLESHTRKIDTIDTTIIKRARKKNKYRRVKRRQNRSAALGRPAMKLLGEL